jgi:hypothetical protein
MRLPDAAHTSARWRIHEIAPDFRLEDVWALPTPGGPDDFPRLVRFATDRPVELNAQGLGVRVSPLHDRLPEDLRETTPPVSDSQALPFTPLYSTNDEWAAEVANETVHGVIHLGWVPDGTGGYRGQLAILVKPNGRRGAAYLTLISPFRHLIVYPAIMRQLERAWRTKASLA